MVDFIRAIAVILGLGVCVFAVTGMLFVIIESGIEIMGGGAG